MILIVLSEGLTQSTLPHSQCHSLKWLKADTSSNGDGKIYHILINSLYNWYQRNIRFFIIVDANGLSSCSTNVANCADSPGKDTVEALAADNDAFIEEFIAVFTKMIEKVQLCNKHWLNRSFATCIIRW